MPQKVVICGAGFLGFNVAKALLSPAKDRLPHRVSQVLLCSRRPQKVHSTLKATVDLDHTRLLPPCPVDITRDSLQAAFENAKVVVSLVGILTGSPETFERVQWKGAENVARAASEVGAKLIHFSAIGADANSRIPYAMTKALGEQAVFSHCPNATVFRPSIVFGPGDSFFTRFASLSKFLPFMPVFGGGMTRFQPVFVGDIARAVQVIIEDEQTRNQVAGQVIEAGGPDILTYREIIDLVLHHTNRWRPVVSIPYAIGALQGAVLERLPETIFTITRDQVEQLKFDNIASTPLKANGPTFSDLVTRATSHPLTSVGAVVPTYI